MEFLFARSLAHGLRNALVESIHVGKQLRREIFTCSKRGGLLLDPSLDLADRFQVLVELLTIRRSELRLQSPGVVSHQIEHGLLVSSVFFAICRARAE
jgi:hypothetical protein